MGRADTDWKNQAPKVLDWIFVAAIAALAALYAGLWWVEGYDHYLGAAVVCAAWLAVYFSDHWQPILYLVLTLVLIPAALDLVFRTGVDQALDALALAFTVVVLSLVVALFLLEERTTPNGA